MSRRRGGGPARWPVVFAGIVMSACASSAAPATTRLTPLTSATTTTAAAAASSSSVGSTTSPATTTNTATVTTTRPTTTPYVVPVEPGVHISYAHAHHDYPASDIFATTGCGTTLVSPVNGRILEVRRTDGWDRRTNNPATRGGLSVAILGDDGVRYYLAHLQAIDDGIEADADVTAGQPLGELGRTGDAGACHVHFGISPPCPGLEWSVRRGVVWPWPYLDAWRSGEQLSPGLEVYGWSLDHPDACAKAEADPNAPLSG